jgi:hypothetical protein
VRHPSPLVGFREAANDIEAAQVCTVLAFKYG